MRLRRKALKASLGRKNEKAINRGPPEMYLYRTRLSRESRKPGRDYDRSIALNPKFADSYCRRGLGHLRRNDEAAASRDFTQCLALSPELKQSIEELILGARKETTAGGPGK
jgi:hypothetical protein